MEKIGQLFQKFDNSRFFNASLHAKRCYEADTSPNLRDKIRNRSIQESSNSITASIQTSLEEVKAVVFEKDESECRDIYTLEAFLSILAHQISNDEGINVHDFY